jgi:hypothetical protein
MLLLSLAAFAQQAVWDLGGTILSEQGVIQPLGFIDSHFDIKYDSPNAEYLSNINPDPLTGPLLDSMLGGGIAIMRGRKSHA